MPLLHYRPSISVIRLALVCCFCLLIFTNSNDVYAQQDTSVTYCPTSCPYSCDSSENGPCGSSGAFASADYCLYPNTGCYDGNPGAGGCCCNQSPIIVDTTGEGFHFSRPTDGVHFQVGPSPPTGYTVSWPVAHSNDAWLTLDRNNNGAIDDITELFGNRTLQPPSKHPNGFLALAVFDSPDQGGNNDGLIDANDSVFSRLRLWKDVNHNGKSETDEIFTLPALGVKAISLSYKESTQIDDNGNVFFYRAKVYRLDGFDDGKWAWDVFLKSAPL